MPIELEKESKNLNKFIEYVEAQVNYTQEEIKSDLLERGLSEEEATYVMTFYKPHIKQRMFSRSFSFCGRIRRLEYCLSFIFFSFLYSYHSSSNRFGCSYNIGRSIYIVIPNSTLLVHIGTGGKALP